MLGLPRLELVNNICVKAIPLFLETFSGRGRNMDNNETCGPVALKTLLLSRYFDIPAFVFAWIARPKCWLLLPRRQ